MPNKPISALRATGALKSALADAGLPSDGDFSASGWSDTIHWGPGFRVDPPRHDGRITWRMTISGLPHLQFQQRFVNRQGEDAPLPSPMHPEQLFQKIRSAFESLGLSPGEITYDSIGRDKDLIFSVVTAAPDWLELYRPPSQRHYYSKPTLVSVTLTRAANIPVAPAKILVGYMSGMDCLLTQESVQALIEASEAQHAANPDSKLNSGAIKNGFSRMTDEGDFITGAPWNGCTTCKKQTIENAWGDQVEVWATPRVWVNVQGDFRPGVPFKLDGEMRSEAPFSLVDEQYGDEAPWRAADAHNPKM